MPIPSVEPETNNIIKFPPVKLNPTAEEALDQYPNMFLEISDPSDIYGFRVKKVLCDVETKFQDVLIVDTVNFGRALMLDGVIQSAENDESLYHEMLVHPAMLSHPNPEHVLILGGGEGATLREVLKHSSVKSVTMVDIDGELVELCRKHLTSWHKGSFDNPKVKLVFEDAVHFLKTDTSSYDVVIVDLIDAVHDESMPPLYTKQFYQNIKRRLKPKGIVAIQAMEFSFLEGTMHGKLWRTVKHVFSQAHSYQVTVPAFLGIWGYILASDWCNPTQLTIEQIQERIRTKLKPNSLQHLTPDYLKSVFVLCKKTSEMLQAEGSIWEEKE